jgi:hypothetical protein
VQCQELTKISLAEKILDEMDTCHPLSMPLRPGAEGLLLDIRLIGGDQQQTVWLRVRDMQKKFVQESKNAIHAGMLSRSILLSVTVFF